MTKLKYTKVQIPIDETGDQRIYFTDDFHFDRGTHYKISKDSIDNILPFSPADESDDPDDVVTDLSYRRILDAIIDEFVETRPLPEGFASTTIWDAWHESKDKYLLEHCSKDYYMVYLSGNGLPDSLIMRMKPKTFKELSDFIWQVPNHKVI